MVQSVVSHGAAFQSLVVLRSEISWVKGVQVIRVPVDWKALKSLNRPLGAALRVGSLAGILTCTSKDFGLVRAELLKIRSDARSNGVDLAELQIDFDSSERQLAGYAEWLRALKEEVRGCRLVFTALPSWLRQAEFHGLAKSADGYVLQVHSFARPQNFSEDFSLCDPRVAEAAVDRASKLGIPFTVALPTYGYEVAFSAAGKYWGISAESERGWPVGSRLKEMRAEPQEMASLIKKWMTKRPAYCEGVIWYRLPVAGEKRNWSWPTLEMVIRGETPIKSSQLAVTWQEDSLAELELRNTGGDEVSISGEVVLAWTGAKLLAGDSLRGFNLVDSEPGHLVFRRASIPTLILKPGERCAVGWLRFTRKVELHETFHF